MVNHLLARWIGVLFLVAMAVSIGGHILIVPIVGHDDYLAEVAASQITVRSAAILMIVNSISVVGIGALVYQVLRQENNFVAISYLATRTVESVTLLFGVISLLSLLTIGEEYAQGSVADGTHLLSMGQSAIIHNWYAYQSAMLVLGVGSLFFCYVLLRRKLIPGYLSVLGLVGYFVLALSSVLAILDFDVGLVVTAPVFFFEVILGLRLVVKGFDSSPAASVNAIS